MKIETSLQDVVVNGKYFATVEGDEEVAMSQYPVLRSMDFEMVPYPYYEPDYLT